ncbi:MAG: YcxB family protein [Halopseudomonas aestusnigri]
MEITVHINRADVFKLYLIQTLRAKSTYITVFCIFLIVFGLMSLKHGVPASIHDFIYYTQTSISIAAGGILLLLVLCIFFSMVFFKKNYGGLKGYECQISTDGICFNSISGETHIKWDGIQKVHLFNSYILYDLGGSKSFFIPKHCFKSSEEFENFINHSKSLWNEAKKYKPTNDTVNKTNHEMSISVAINRTKAFSCNCSLFLRTKPLYIGLFVVTIAVDLLLLFKIGLPETTDHWFLLFKISIIACVGTIVCSFILLLIGTFSRYPRKTNKTHQVFYEANTEGLLIKTSICESTIKWNKINNLKDMKSFLYLQYDLVQSSYIPKIYFYSPTEYQAFASYVMTQWKSSKDAKT